MRDDEKSYKLSALIWSIFSVEKLWVVYFLKQNIIQATDHFEK